MPAELTDLLDPDSPDAWPIPPQPVPLSRAMASRFLSLLAEGYSPTKAAQALGKHRTAFYNLRSRWPEFAAAWQTSLEASVDVLEDAAMTRAVHGVVRKQFFQGEVIPGSEYREYSDSLLLALLKARAPEAYRERYDINQRVDINIDSEQRIYAARARAGFAHIQTIDVTPTSVTQHQEPLDDLLD